MASTGETATPFKKWYSKHKVEFAEKRKTRYETDPVYRQKALDRAHVYRKTVRQAALPPPSQYTYTALALCEELDVPYNTMRAWRFRKLFPSPFKYRGLTYFTDAQALLLVKLQRFLMKYPRRRSPEADKKLQDLVALIYANWN
jgi:hypothetical protein